MSGQAVDWPRAVGRERARVLSCSRSCLDSQGSMKTMPENPNRGSSFEDFLKEEGIFEASTTAAVKKVLAWQIKQAMRTQHITKSAMATRMHTSRSQLERLLDPEKTGVSLETIQRAAAVVGRKLRVELV